MARYVTSLKDSTFLPVRWGEIRMWHSTKTITMQWIIGVVAGI
jgi:hypothetical protein